MKKYIVIVITVLFIIQSMAFAETSHEKLQQDSAAIMVRLGLLKGYQNGELGLERNITRAEFASIIIRMMGYEENPISVGKEIAFKDLSEKHWAYSSVRIAASLGYIKGYPDKTFRPSNNITYAEAIAIMIRLLNYESNLKGEWPDNYVKKANEIGITKNLEVIPKKVITRGEVSILVVDSLMLETGNSENK